MHSALFRRSARSAVAVAVALSVLLLAACQGDPVAKAPGRTAGPSMTAVAGTMARPAARLFPKSLPAPRATCTNAPAGWSKRENGKPGSGDLPPSREVPGVGLVAGYLDSSTAVCGQTMSVHLSGQNGTARVRLRALRVGDYRGRGSRQVWQSPVITARWQQKAVPTGPNRVIAERWPVAATIPVDASWPPGMYLVEIAPVGQGQPSFIPLVVRTSGVRSPHLVVASDLTWLAYNQWGRHSLYFGPGRNRTEIVANRSYEASVDRPLDGTGMRTVFTMNLPLVRFLSRNGVPYDVTTDSSLDATPAQLTGRPTVLVGGHSEYWTRRMYDAAVRARDAGTNFGFLGANEVYWQGRIERDRSGRPSALTVYRDARLDPLAKARPAAATVRWRQAPLRRDPAALVGVGMSAVGVRGSYVVRSAPSWLFAGTHLTKGSVLRLAIGNEADAQQPPTGRSPVNLQVVLHGVAVPAGRAKPSLITAAYYSAPSGAGVFAAGTTYWVCGLDSTCPLGPTPRATSVALQRITLNLLHAFAAPGAGRLHPSVGTPYVSPAELARTLPVGGAAAGGEG